MWKVLGLEALIGAGLVAVGLDFKLDWGHTNAMVCGALAIALALLTGASRLREARWLTFALAAWLMASTIMLDALGPFELACGAAAVALTLIVGPLGVLVRP